MAVLTWDSKDPDEVLDYQVNWADRLAEGDTLESSSWIAPDGALVVVSDSFTTTTTTIWLSGGELGESYDLVNRVVTVGGRTHDQTVRLKVRAK